MSAIGLTGSERKNFVPVDWVSSVMNHILGKPEYYGNTYHLVTRHPVAVSKIADVVQQAVETYSTLATEADVSRCDADWFARSFFSEMAVYRAYWRDDPEFDDTNTVAAAPHLPCPEFDDGKLLRLSKYAIEHNFGKMRSPRVKLDFDVHEHFEAVCFPLRGSSVIAAARQRWDFRWTAPEGANGASYCTRGDWLQSSRG